jgi:transcriptional regulator with XRE-family HTH domain
MKAAEWIDRLKQERGWESDYRVAKELGIHRATVSSYRTKTPTLDDETAAKVADALSIDPHIIVIDQVAERTSVDAVRVGLADLLARLTKRKGPRLGGGGVVDITSAASIAPGGEPDRVHTTRPEYTSYSPATAVQRLLLAMRALILPAGAALGA